MKTRKLVSFDFAIKYLLRQKDNFEILEGFLTALLNEPIEVLDIIESESNKHSDISKGNRVDLMIRDSQDRRMIVEIQHASESDYLERMVFETAKTIVDNLDKGKSYGNIVKVISINILYFNLGEGNGYLYKGELQFTDMYEKHKDKAVLKYSTDKLPEYYLIRTTKFKNKFNTDLDDWIYMFKNNEVREDATTKGLVLAKEKLDILKMDEIQKREYDSFIHNRRISNSMLETAKAEGLEAGLKLGEEKGLKLGEKKLKQEKIEIAKNLLDVLDDETIALKTKLSIKKVKEIRKSTIQ
ncbi:hypothetical protein AN396_04115 [Candidatus Epulonipiscium fishelsonii]|uniref:Uncharacterized protein n=1 Tax=Candidatus Epulonipiscium fishelsonii TaxID=77094 RepID=A0ACC8XDF7_9FIRM|nr:hypothetical protein AN396_04115 [Epulopiscium sp. SCG-B11WGA-EpuloA1]